MKIKNKDIQWIDIQELCFGNELSCKSEECIIIQVKDIEKYRDKINKE
jgi:hypothetical protein